MKLIGLTMLLVVGCASPRQYGDGEYAGAGYDEPTHMNEGLNEYDARVLSQGVLKGMGDKCGERERLRLSMVARFDNQTTELLDLPMLTRELTDKMQNSGYRMVDKSSRPDLHDEFKWVESGYVRPDTAPVKGKVEPVRNLVRVVVSSRTQQNGDIKFVRYRMSAQVVDAENGMVVCVGEEELRKKFKRVQRAL